MRPEPPWRRAEGWPERLAEFLAERADVPFEWGSQDCVTVAADACVVLTGRDPIAAYRGLYSSEEGGDAIVGEQGLQAFLARLMAEFGAPECSPSLAQRGDWAMVTVGNQLITGVVVGATVAAPGLRGLAHVPLRRAVCAWAI